MKKKDIVQKILKVVEPSKDAISLFGKKEEKIMLRRQVIFHFSQ